MSKWLFEHPWAIYVTIIFTAAVAYAVCEWLTNRTKKTLDKITKDIVESEKRQPLVDPSSIGALESADVAKTETEIHRVAPDANRTKAWEQIWAIIKRETEQSHTTAEIGGELYTKIPYDMLCDTLRANKYKLRRFSGGEFTKETYDHKFFLMITWE